MLKPWIASCLKVVGVVAIAAALSGCAVYPYGPRYGYYYHPHPHYYY